MTGTIIEVIGDIQDRLRKGKNVKAGSSAFKIDLEGPKAKTELLEGVESLPYDEVCELRRVLLTINAGQWEDLRFILTKKQTQVVDDLLLACYRPPKDKEIERGPLEDDEKDAVEHFLEHATDLIEQGGTADAPKIFQTVFTVNVDGSDARGEVFDGIKRLSPVNACILERSLSTIMAAEKESEHKSSTTQKEFIEDLRRMCYRTMYPE